MKGASYETNLEIQQSDFNPLSANLTKLGFTSCKAEEPLQVMELQEKEENIERCLERT